MRKLLSIAFLLIFAAACRNSDKPDYVISEDQLVTILVDIHITEGIASSLPIPYDSSQVVYTLLEKEVFEKHEVSDSVFTQSLLFYLKDPQLMDEVYGRVVDSLSKKQTIQAAEQQNK